MTWSSFLFPSNRPVLLLLRIKKQLSFLLPSCTHVSGAHTSLTHTSHTHTSHLTPLLITSLTHTSHLHLTPLLLTPHTYSHLHLLTPLSLTPSAQTSDAVALHAEHGCVPVLIPVLMLISSHSCVLIPVFSFPSHPPRLVVLLRPMLNTIL